MSTPNKYLDQYGQNMSRTHSHHVIMICLLDLILNLMKLGPYTKTHKQWERGLGV